MNVVRAVTTTGDSTTFYFDVEYGLIAGVRPRASAKEHGDTTAMLKFGDYKRYFGTLVPTRLTVVTAGHDVVTRTVQIDHVPIDSAKFGPPAAVLSLLPRRH